MILIWKKTKKTKDRKKNSWWQLNKAPLAKNIAQNTPLLNRLIKSKPNSNLTPSSIAQTLINAYPSLDLSTKSLPLVRKLVESFVNIEIARNHHTHALNARKFENYQIPILLPIMGEVNRIMEKQINDVLTSIETYHKLNQIIHYAKAFISSEKIYISTHPNFEMKAMTTNLVQMVWSLIDLLGSKNQPEISEQLYSFLASVIPLVKADTH